MKSPQKKTYRNIFKKESEPYKKGWWQHFWAGARAPVPGRARPRSLGPRAPAQKMLPPTLLIWFAFLFKYVSICFLVGFSCFLMTSSWFYMFFDDIFMLFEGAFDGWKAPLSCVCLACLPLFGLGWLFAWLSTRKSQQSHPEMKKTFGKVDKSIGCKAEKVQFFIPILDLTVSSPKGPKTGAAGIF